MWVRTVLELTERLRAISAPGAPEASKASTSNSRAVSCSARRSRS